MGGHDLDWERLGRYVLDRRRELGLTQPELQAAGGPGAATIRLIEGAKATSYSGRKLRDLEAALEWRQGSINAILNGGEPRPVGAAPTTGETDWNARLAQVAAIADNPKNSEAMRNLARTQMRLIDEQIQAVLDAARAEEGPRRERTG